MLGISCQTLYRRVDEYGIPWRDTSEISSTELDELIRGHLLGLGIRVPHSNVRSSIHHVDHENTLLRCSQVVKRRQYSVECINSIWHIDGHHKHIRWRFVVHAGVVGTKCCTLSWRPQHDCCCCHQCTWSTSFYRRWSSHYS